MMNYIVFRAEMKPYTKSDYTHVLYMLLSGYIFYTYIHIHTMLVGCVMEHFLFRDLYTNNLTGIHIHISYHRVELEYNMELYPYKKCTAHRSYHTYLHIESWYGMPPLAKEKNFFRWRKKGKYRKTFSHIKKIWIECFA